MQEWTTKTVKMLGNCCGQATSVAQQQPFPRVSTLTSTASHSRGADSARGLHEHCPSRKEGAGNAGCTLHPRSRVQDAQGNAHTSIQVQRKHSGIPCAMALRLMP